MISTAVIVVTPNIYTQELKNSSCWSLAILLAQCFIPFSDLTYSWVNAKIVKTKGTKSLKLPDATKIFQYTSAVTVTACLSSSFASFVKRPFFLDLEILLSSSVSDSYSVSALSCWADVATVVASDDKVSCKETIFVLFEFWI
jgi:hypothetical protein